MKYMIASDIHGSSYFCKLLLDRFHQSGADRLILLGDLLYHGPRNDLPKDYAPKQVIAMLSEIKDRLLCVRGNCDTEVDQMVLPFPMLADYAMLLLDDTVVYATHGHHAGEDNPPMLKNGEVLLCGHTHVAKCQKHDSFLYLNPGSVSIPKENTGHGYIIYENKTFTRHLLAGEGVEFTVRI